MKRIDNLLVELLRAGEIEIEEAAAIAAGVRVQWEAHDKQGPAHEELLSRFGTFTADGVGKLMTDVD